MKIVYIAHAISSCWNNGNAHFLRGLLRELVRLGHDVVPLEVSDGWSRRNLLADAGEGPLRTFRRLFPELNVRTYGRSEDVLDTIDGADLVIVHEWVEREIVAAVSRVRLRGGAFQLLFHDTHHRALTSAEGIGRLDLSAFDGILAFGRSLADIYEGAGFGGRVFVLHEAADVRLFAREAPEDARRGIVWIGNWGDGERSAEIERYLLSPVAALKAGLDVYGVRYPEEGLAALRRAGATHHGFLAHADVPRVFARHLATVHIPRRIYVEQLAGIPTIRMFEALAAGVPLVSAPWRDTEGLFVEGEDYLLARSEREMRQHLHLLLHDEASRQALSGSGRARIEAHHTCRHRALEVLDIFARLRGGQPAHASAGSNLTGAVA